MIGALNWFFTNGNVARWVALPIWLGLAIALTIPARRRLFGTPLYADDLLFAAWLLILNRVAFSVNALWHDDAFGNLTRWTGIVAALFYAYVVSSYLRPARA